jgi:hypothetical protein
MVASYDTGACAACCGDLSADAKAMNRTIERLATAISRARLMSPSATSNALLELDYRKCARCGAICGNGSASAHAISGSEAAAKLVALKRLLATERRAAVSSRSGRASRSAAHTNRVLHPQVPAAFGNDRAPHSSAR